MAVGGGLILVGTAGALGAAFFIAEAVATPPIAVAIKGTTKFPIMIKVARHYNRLKLKCQAFS
jgi:hypothetical protein